MWEGGGPYNRRLILILSVTPPETCGLNQKEEQLLQGSSVLAKQSPWLSQSRLADSSAGRILRDRLTKMSSHPDLPAVHTGGEGPVGTVY